MSLKTKASIVNLIQPDSGCWGTADPHFGLHEDAVYIEVVRKATVFHGTVLMPLGLLQQHQSRQP